jgi:hypothetical protein
MIQFVSMYQINLYSVLLSVSRMIIVLLVIDSHFKAENMVHLASVDLSI